MDSLHKHNPTLNYLDGIRISPFTPNPPVSETDSEYTNLVNLIINSYRPLTKPDAELLQGSQNILTLTAPYPPLPTFINAYALPIIVSLCGFSHLYNPPDFVKYTIAVSATILGLCLLIFNASQHFTNTLPQVLSVRDFASTVENETLYSLKNHFDALALYAHLHADDPKIKALADKFDHSSLITSLQTQTTQHEKINTAVHSLSETMLRIKTGQISPFTPMKNSFRGTPCRRKLS